METFTFADLYSSLATIESNNQRIEVSGKQIGDGGVGVPALEKGSREAAIAIEMHRLRGETNALYESTFSRRAVSDLQVLCEAESGERITTQKLRQFRAIFCQRTGCTIHEANQTDLTEIVSELSKGPKPAEELIQNAASVPGGDESVSEVCNIKLLRKTGSGLYGVVWEAEQTHLQRKVAVKIINPSMRNAASALEHAKALARVDSHENIVTVYDVAKVECSGVEGLVDGIIMEWLEGERLGDRLSGAAFSTTKCNSVCSAVLNGLEFMHSQDIVHGDLHAGNVMLTASSTKIIDIDVADEYSVSRLTSMSRDQRITADIRNIGYVVWSVLRHSAIPLDQLVTFENRFRSANSLQEIRESLDAVLSNDELK